MVHRLSKTSRHRSFDLNPIDPEIEGGSDAVALSGFAENSAGGGERNAGAEPFEQRGVQFLLQLAHLGADGGLCAITGLSGLGEALEPDDLQKSMKLVQIHITLSCPAVVLSVAVGVA